MVAEFIETGLATVLLLIAPGYAALLLINRVRGQRRISHDLTAALLSLVLSTVILALFYSAFRFPSWDEALTFTTGQPLLALVGLGALVVIVGIGTPRFILPGLDMVVAYARMGVFKKEPVPNAAQELWDVFMRRFQLHPILVETSDNKSYMGFLAGFSTEEEEPSIHLEPAHEVTYDRDGNETINDIGVAVLLLPQDIKRIVVLRGSTGSVGDGDAQ